MAKRKTLKGLGSRYGRRTRNKLQAFAELKHKAKKCPYCHALRVKRLSVGIWNCTKCKAKFTGRAFDIGKARIKEVENGEL